MRYGHTHIAIAALFFLFLLTNASAIEPEYTDYKPSGPSKHWFFQLSFDSEDISLSFETGHGSRTYNYPTRSVRKSADEVKIGDNVVITEEGIVVGEDLLAFDRVVDMRILQSDDRTTILFYRASGATNNVGRMKRGNIISPFDDVRVAAGDFVRGAIFTVVGDVEIEGEVNKDIVSLFGDVFISPEAVARGDIASITGRVTLARDASVYGEVYTGTQRHRGRSRRFYREDNEVTLGGDFYYDRVDGATPAIVATYRDRDSLLPSLDLGFGYAFNSERTRWKVGLEQTVSRDFPLAIGGEVYRHLATEDDWIMERDENTFFTLLWTEDFRDYYESQGGRAYIKTRPLEHLTLQGGYQYDETRFFKAGRNLWSLFGGDKRFPRNFHRVDEAYREIGIAELDSTTNAVLNASLLYDARDEEAPYEFSAWYARAWLEWASDGVGSDFDYHRYQLSLARYQKLNRRVMFIGRLTVGNSEGYVPMYKRFYLGGVGTLRGYKNKELMGTRFWLANGEYRFQFPHSDLAFSLIYDAGQIANDEKINSDVEFRHSLGAALYIGDDVRLSLAKRLDGSGNEKLQFYARINHSL